MVEKPDNNKTNKLCGYLVTNDIEKNRTFLSSIWASASFCKSFTGL
jgi:hypothetical protein